MLSAVAWVHHESGPVHPDWTSVVSAIAAVVSAVLVVGGAIAAARYLIRGVTSVEATASAVDGGLILHVRPAIASQGATALRLEHEIENAPSIEVVEYTRAGPSDVGVSRSVFEGDDLVGPGETVVGSAIFFVDPPSRDVLGWQVTFTVGVPRWFGRRWFWVASTFVPRPVVPGRTRGQA